MKLTLSILSSCKNHVIQAYYQKTDFIEKTCRSNEYLDQIRFDAGRPETFIIAATILIVM